MIYGKKFRVQVHSDRSIDRYYPLNPKYEIAQLKLETKDAANLTFNFTFRFYRKMNFNAR